MDDGIYRIKHKIHDLIDYEIKNNKDNTFFKEIKFRVDKSLKVLK